MPSPPEGFISYRGTSPYLDLIGPIYESAEGAMVVGVWLENKHCNARGFVHGGLLVALADTVLGHTIVRSDPEERSIVTVSLTTDFVSSARSGEWLQGSAEVKRRGSRLSFADATFFVADRLVLTASGIFAGQPASPDAISKA